MLGITATLRVSVALVRDESLLWQLAEVSAFLRDGDVFGRPRSTMTAIPCPRRGCTCCARGLHHFHLPRITRSIPARARAGAGTGPGPGAGDQREKLLPRRRGEKEKA